MRAAEHHVDAGDPRRAQGYCSRRRSSRCRPVEERAQALLLLAEVHYKDDSFPAARELLERAPGREWEAPSAFPRDGRSEAHLHEIFNLGLVPAAAAPAASAAFARAGQVGEPALLAQALAVSVMIDFTLGRGVDGAPAQAARSRSRIRTCGRGTSCSHGSSAHSSISGPAGSVRRGRCWTRCPRARRIGGRSKLGPGRGLVRSGSNAGRGPRGRKPDRRGGGRARSRLDTRSGGHSPWLRGRRSTRTPGMPRARRACEEAIELGRARDGTRCWSR